MKKILRTRTWLMRTLALLMALTGAVAATAANKLYLPESTIEQGETKTLQLYLENDQVLKSFQVDIELPYGLNMVTSGSDAAWSLTSRADETFSTFSNQISTNHWRLGTLSLTGNSFKGTSGALINIQVTAASDFAGGTITLSNVKFVDSNDKDVDFDGSTSKITVPGVDPITLKCYIEDFEIEAGATKTVAVILTNPDAYTSFQMDIYLPDGLTVVDDSFAKTDRLTSSHSLTTRKSSKTNAVRVACLSASSAAIGGSTGAIFTFQVTASKNAASGDIEIKNTRFVLTDDAATENKLDETTAAVTVTAQVTSTLADILADYDNQNKRVEVSDKLLVVYLYDNEDGNTVLVAKDANNYAEPYKAGEGEVDFMRLNSSNPMHNKDYDQSNWVRIVLPSAITTDQNYTNYEITGVTGVLSDIVNPVIEAAQLPERGDASSYTPNTFIGPNFYGTQTGIDGNTYFFVQPKAQEYALFQWVEYIGDNTFDTPLYDDTRAKGNPNAYSLQGTFEVDNSLCEGYDASDSEKSWQNGMVYNEVPCIITKMVQIQSTSSPKEATSRSAVVQPLILYTVYPLQFKSGTDIVTGVDDVMTLAKEVESVQYVDVAGRIYNAAQPGVNIVVTRYTDGTKSVVKKVMK